jgi:predicted amidohydrolase
MRHAVIQCCSNLDWKENLDTVEHLCSEACREGAQVLVLPEYFACFGDFDRAAFAKNTTPKILDRLSHLAKTLKITLFGGTVPTLSLEQHKVYNTMHVYNHLGECCTYYHKIHLFNFNHGQYQESATHTAGDKSCSYTVNTWSYALSICYDIRFPELYRHLLPFDVLILPVAFVAENGRAHWEVLLRARAIENQCYVLASAQEGHHECGRETYGHSMIIDPWGNIMDCLPKGIGWAIADLSHEEQKNIRDRLPALQHRKILSF